MVWPFTLALPKCVHLSYLRHVSLSTKICELLQLIIICTLYNCAIFIDSHTSVNKFYFISSLLINTVILLWNYRIYCNKRPSLLIAAPLFSTFAKFIFRGFISLSTANTFAIPGFRKMVHFSTSQANIAYEKFATSERSRRLTVARFVTYLSGHPVDFAVILTKMKGENIFYIESVNIHLFQCF